MYRVVRIRWPAGWMFAWEKITFFKWKKNKIEIVMVLSDAKWLGFRSMNSLFDSTTIRHEMNRLESYAKKFLVNLINCDWEFSKIGTGTRAHTHMRVVFWLRCKYLLKADKNKSVEKKYWTISTARNARASSSKLCSSAYWMTAR